MTLLHGMGLISCSPCIAQAQKSTTRAEQLWCKVQLWNALCCLCTVCEE